MLPWYLIKLYKQLTYSLSFIAFLYSLVIFIHTPPIFGSFSLIIVFVILLICGQLLRGEHFQLLI